MIRIIKRLLYIFTKKQKIRYTFIFLLQLMGSVFDLFGITLLVPFMSVVMDAEAIMKKDIVARAMSFFHISTGRELIIYMIVGLIAIFILKNLCMILILYIQLNVLWRDQKKLEKSLLDYYSAREYSYHVTHNSAEIMRVISTDVGNVYNALRQILSLASQIITAALVVVFLFTSSKSITICLASLLLLFLFFYFKIIKKRLVLYGHIFQETGTEGIKWIRQLFDGIKEIKIKRIESYFTDKFETVRTKQYSMGKRMAFFEQMPRFILELMTVCGILMVLLVKAINGTDLSGMISQLTVVAIAAYKLIPSANKISSGVSALYNNYVSIEFVADAMKDYRNKQAYTDLIKVKNEKSIPIDSNGEIELHDVSFSYTENGPYILKNANLKIERGQSVGIKGPSGAGKTTTIDLILGIIKPQEGYISYCGVDIENLSDTWNKHIGYIPQNIMLCDDTIRNNVAYGETNPDDDKVWAAIEEAQLKKFVLSEKDGLDTMVGESGVRLSGGQRQRIGIARALYNNPDILVMDEATSALDNETEAAVMESIDKFKGKKTLIIIAHRLSTIEKCDIIYEVSDGKIKRLDER